MDCGAEALMGALKSCVDLSKLIMLEIGVGIKGIKYVDFTKSSPKLSEVTLGEGNFNDDKIIASAFVASLKPMHASYILKDERFTISIER